MLVKLYALPDFSTLKNQLQQQQFVFRRPLAAEKSIILEWVTKYFGSGWASEVDVSFSYQPIACFITLKDSCIVGFACYDAAYRNFFGPTGVDPSYRGVGIGKILLMESLQAMKAQGFAYAIIGGVGPAEFYHKAVGATLIPGSNPGIYEGILSEVPVS